MVGGAEGTIRMTRRAHKYTGRSEATAYGSVTSKPFAFKTQEVSLRPSQFTIPVPETFTGHVRASGSTGVAGPGAPFFVPHLQSAGGVNMY